MSDVSSEEPRTIEWSVPWGPAWGIIAAVSAYVFSLGLSAIPALLFRYSDSLSVTQTIIVYATSSIGLIIAIGIFLFLKRCSLRTFFGRLRKADLISIPLYYVGYLVITYSVQSIMTALPSYDAGQDQSLGLDGASGLALLGVLFVLVALPPIAEEMVFRGVLYRGMARRWNKYVAAFITSALFGLAHGQWNVAADTFVLSIVLIFALERQKTLWVPVGIHALKNFIAYLFVFVLIR